MLFLFAPQVRVPLGEGQMGPFEVRTLTKEGATIDVPRAGQCADEWEECLGAVHDDGAGAARRSTTCVCYRKRMIMALEGGE